MLNKTNLLLGTAMAASLIATPAFAQEFEDEVITTATKREQTLQETPVAVSVTGAEVIENARIADVNDLQSVVPSLRVTQLQTSANTNFIIRGFGNGANNAGIEPSVGVFVDGVYRSRSSAQIGNLPKLERVEVLRGPQSTLFGKNASAGVISIVTAAPSFDKEGYIEGGVQNYNGYSGKAYYTNALSDTAAFSIGGGFEKRDGYFDSAIDGLPESNSRDRWDIRGQLLFDLSERATLRIIGDISQIDEFCCSVTNFQNQGASAAIAALGGQFADDSDPFSYDYFTNKAPENTVDDWGLSGHFDYDFDNFTLTSITAYRENDYVANYDADYNTLALLDNVNIDQGLETFTQEVRLTSTTDGPFQWMVGGYYFTEDVKANSGLQYGNQLRAYIDVLIDGAPGMPMAPGTLGGIEQLYAQPFGTFFNDNVDIQEFFSQDNTTWSLFGTVDFDISDKLTATVGLNYTEDEKTVTGRTINNDVFSSIDFDSTPTVFGISFVDFNVLQAAGLAPTPTNLAALQGGNPALYAFIQGQVLAGLAPLRPLQFQPPFLDFPNVVEDGKSKDDNLSYTVRLAYEVNDNLNVYGSYATGFKATSWNLSRDSRPFIADAAAIMSAGIEQPNQNYLTRFAGPEESKVLEFGLKARFEKGAINVAIFDQTIEGFQSNTFLGTGFALANAGEQSTKGLEFDAALYPTDNLTFNIAGTFLDPVYDSFTGAPQGDLSGQQVAGIPERAMSIGAQYDNTFANGVDYYIRGDYQYESEVQVVEDIANALSQPQRKVGVFNGSVGLGFDNGVDVQFWIRNAFNDEYYLSAFPGVAQAGIVNAYPNAPRTYGLNVRKNF